MKKNIGIGVSVCLFVFFVILSIASSNGSEIHTMSFMTSAFDCFSPTKISQDDTLASHVKLQVDNMQSYDPQESRRYAWGVSWGDTQ